jgi:hypothetical protein
MKLKDFTPFFATAAMSVPDIPKTISVENAMQYLTMCIDAATKEENKYARLPKSELTAMVAANTITQTQMDEIQKKKSQIHVLTIQYWKKIELMKTPQKDQVLYLINHLRVLLLLPILKEGGNLEDDNAKSLAFRDKILGTAGA